MQALKLFGHFFITCRYFLFGMFEIFISLIKACMQWWFTDRTGRKNKISLDYILGYINDCSYLLFVILLFKRSYEYFIYTRLRRNRKHDWFDYYCGLEIFTGYKETAGFIFLFMTVVMDTNWYYLGTCSFFIGWLIIICKQWRAWQY